MHKIKLIINPLFSIALVCFISTMISKYLSITKPFKIDTIEISGNEYIDNTQVLKTIKEYVRNANNRLAFKNATRVMVAGNS